MPRPRVRSIGLLTLRGKCGARERAGEGIGLSPARARASGNSWAGCGLSGTRRWLRFFARPLRMVSNGRVDSRSRSARLVAASSAHLNRSGGQVGQYARSSVPWAPARPRWLATRCGLPRNGVPRPIGVAVAQPGRRIAHATTIDAQKMDRTTLQMDLPPSWAKRRGANP